MQMYIAYHDHLFVLGHFGAELKICGDGHRFFNGQITVQLVVLHDVGTEFAELAEVALLAVHLDGAILDVGGSLYTKKGNLNDIPFEMYV